MVYSLDCLTIVAVCVIASFVSEGVLYFWIYRSASFRSLKDQLERTAKKLDVLKQQSVAVGKQKAKEKRVEKLESSIKREAAKELSIVRFKQAIVMFAFGIGLYNLMSRWYVAPVAKLPFVPFSFVANLSHRLLPGEDMTDCSMAFIYALCQAGLRPAVTKWLDLGLSRKMVAMQEFQPPTYDK
ncbi:hypothetical protein WJX72_005785 [[Myrmecia] bisecta]|uniref:Calcium load-activated calcium channel n=1 Tax=[Myrmecia] bisecta TaxID=41462 RepID=A0AAW1QFR7_9CHLO